MSGVQHITVDVDDEGARIDRWFKRHYPEIGFGQLQRLMRKGDIRLNGKRVKGKEKVQAGQTVRVPPMGFYVKPENTKQPERMTLSTDDIADVQSWVLYKDDAVIVLNKPAGLPTQGGTGQTRHLDGMLDALKFGYDKRPKLVHRLDKDTSGALVLARTTPAAAVLAKSFQDRGTDKRYWALVMGSPRLAEGRIKLKMEKAPIKGNERMIVTSSGKPSMTDYEVIDRAAPRASWLALKPHTGRTHQIRLHCAEIGHPIVGDGKYGGAESFLGGSISNKLHLHSAAIRFDHPDGLAKGRVIEVQAPLPPHMAASFDMLGFDANHYSDPDFDA